MTRPVKLDYLFAGSGDSMVLEPAYAIVEQLQTLDPGVATGLVGDGRVLEYARAKERGVPYWSSTGSRAANRLEFLNRSPERRLLDRIQPSVVVCMGGEVETTVARAAAYLGIPCVQLQQDAEPCALPPRMTRCIDLICAGFKNALPSANPSCPIRVTGLPIRQEFVRAGATRADSRKSQQRRMIILEDPESPPIDNADVPRAVARLRHELPNWRLVHQTRVEAIADLKSWYYRCGVDAVVTARIHRLPHQLATADLVIAPGNASRLFQLAAVGTPAVILPRRGEVGENQIANAARFARASACKAVSPNDRLNSLTDHLATLLGNPDRIQKMGQAIGGLAQPDAAAEVASLICGIGQTSRSNRRRPAKPRQRKKTSFAALAD